MTKHKSALSEEKSRQETAVFKMLEAIDLKKRLEDIEEEIDELLLVSEYKEPGSVGGLRLERIPAALIPCDHVGHTVIFGKAEVSLHSGNAEPGNVIFRRVFNAWKGKIL